MSSPINTVNKRPLEPSSLADAGDTLKKKQNTDFTRQINLILRRLICKMLNIIIDIFINNKSITNKDDSTIKNKFKDQSYLIMYSILDKFNKWFPVLLKTMWVPNLSYKVIIENLLVFGNNEVLKQPDKNVEKFIGWKKLCHSNDSNDSAININTQVNDPAPSQNEKDVNSKLLELCGVFKTILDKFQTDKSVVSVVGKLTSELSSIDAVKSYIKTANYTTYVSTYYGTEGFGTVLYFLFDDSGINGIKKINGVKDIDINIFIVSLIYIFSNDILKFCYPDNLSDMNKHINDEYIGIIHRLYYDVFCNNKFTIENNNLRKNFISNGLSTYTIFLYPLNKSNVKTLQLVPHFIGVLVMLMTEIKHDFNASRGSGGLTTAELDVIKEMVRFLLQTYISDILKNSATTVGYNILNKFTTFFDKKTKAFDYLSEEDCQKFILEIYNLNKIICVQEKPKGDYFISSTPDKISSTFPKVFSENKTVILSADAKNTLSISINPVNSLYRLTKKDFPFLYFDAGNASNISEQTQQGERDITLLNTNETLKTVNTKYEIEVFNLWNEKVFTIKMNYSIPSKKWFFTLSFSHVVSQTPPQSIPQSILIINSALTLKPITFENVSITNVKKIYDDVYSIIDKTMDSNRKIYNSKTINNTKDNTLQKYIYSILVSTISLKSMGDLLTYYITLIESVDNLKLSNLNSEENNIKKKFIGVVSSADFSLMQLPLVNIRVPSSEKNNQNFVLYEPPCSLFASVHIKNSEYVVPLNSQERKKIFFWEYISNRVTNIPVNLQTITGINPSLNPEFNCCFNYLRYFIDYFYDLYWDKLISKKLSDHISIVINSMLHYFISINNVNSYNNWKQTKSINSDLCTDLKSVLTIIEKNSTLNYDYSCKTQLIEMVSNAICECNGFYNFKKNYNDCLSNFCKNIYNKFITDSNDYNCFRPCFDYDYSNSNSEFCRQYFGNYKFNIKYGKKGNLEYDYFSGIVTTYNNTFNNCNVLYDDDDTEQSVPLNRIKCIFDFSENIRSQDEKMYSLAEYAVYNCTVSMPSKVNSSSSSSSSISRKKRGGINLRSNENKNTKTYKKKYIKNKVTKTVNKKIKNNMNKTRGNKKLIKKIHNTLKKK
jgi:hypothetical protein